MPCKLTKLVWTTNIICHADQWFSLFVQLKTVLCNKQHENEADNDQETSKCKDSLIKSHQKLIVNDITFEHKRFGTDVGVIHVEGYQFTQTIWFVVPAI